MGRKSVTNTEYNMEVGQRIMALRRSQSPKMSRQKLAEILGYSEGNTVFYWENGRSPVPADVLVRIANLFNVNIDYLLGDEPDETDEYLSMIKDSLDELAIANAKLVPYLEKSIQNAINVINDDFTTYMEKSVRNAIELFAILDTKEGVC